MKTLHSDLNIKLLNIEKPIQWRELVKDKLDKKSLLGVDNKMENVVNNQIIGSNSNQERHLLFLPDFFEKKPALLLLKQQCKEINILEHYLIIIHPDKIGLKILIHNFTKKADVLYLATNLQEGFNCLLAQLGKPVISNLSDNFYLEKTVKNYLQFIRSYLRFKLMSETSVSSMQKILNDINNKLRDMLIYLIQECLKHKQKYSNKNIPPHAFVLLGSYARREATPYSDCEYFILVKNKGNIAYFKDVCEFMHKIIYALKEFPSIEKNKIIGFFIDISKNPLSDEVELIGTPGDIANLHNQFIHKPGNHLSSALLTCDWLPTQDKGEDFKLDY